MFWHHLCSVFFFIHKRSHDVVFCPKKQKLHQADAQQLLFHKNGILSLHKLSVKVEEVTKQLTIHFIEILKELSDRDLVFWLLNGVMCRTASYRFCPHGGANVQSFYELEVAIDSTALCRCCQ